MLGTTQQTYICTAISAGEAEKLHFGIVREASVPVKGILN